MTSSNQTPPEQHASERTRVAMTMIVQFAVLIVLGWAVALYVNWSSAAAMSEFMAVTGPHASVPGEAHASTPLRPVHHRAAICPKSA